VLDQALLRFRPGVQNQRFAATGSQKHGQWCWHTGPPG
jgi:hypothetical protein